MFERYAIQQGNTDHSKLEEKLECCNITIKTSYQVNKEASASSFFNKLSLPTFEEYVDRKVKKDKFTFIEWKDKSQELQSSYDKVISFKTRKTDYHCVKKYQEALEKMTSLLSRKEKLLLLVFSDRYTEKQSRHPWEEVQEQPMTLDNYLEFYADAKIGFSTENILGGVSSVFLSKTNENKIISNRSSHIPMFSLLRLVLMCSEEANKDLIETVNNLQSATPLLRLILKGNKSLQSFRTDPKRLVKIVKYNDRHYSRYSFNNSYTTGLKLKKEQAIEFAKFYLTSTDKRLNSNNIINELVLHLRKYDEYELISELILSHHRVYSSVIAGKITMDSYSSETLSFFKPCPFD